MAVKTLEEIRAEIEEKISAHTEAVDEKPDEARKLLSEIFELQEEYNDLSRDETFGAIRIKCNSDKIAIMREACVMYEFPTIKVSELKDGGEPLGVYEIVDTAKVIDLEKLHKYCGGIGAKTTWAPQVEQASRLLALKVAESIDAANKDEIREKFKMSKAARKLADIDRVSNGDVLRALRVVVGEMIGEEEVSKVLSFDTRFTILSYTREGRASNTIRVANRKTAIRILMKVCRHIITGEPYGEEFPTKKAK